MNKIRKTIFGKCMKRIFIYLIIGSVFLALGMPAWKSYKAEPVDFESLDFSQDLSGTYVKGTIEFIYDNYCEETRNNSAISRDYIINAGDYHYMSLHVMKSKFEEIEQLMQASWDYAEEKSTLDTLLAHRYEFEGIITKIPSDTLVYYNQYLNTCNLTAEEREMFLPFALEPQTKSDRLLFFAAFGIVTGICYLIALVKFICLLTGWHTRNIRRYIKKSADPVATKEKVDHFLQNTKPFHGVYCNEHLICGFTGCTALIGETRKIVWAHQFTVNHKYAGIFTYKKEFSLNVYFHDFQYGSICLDMKKALHVRQLIGRLTRYYPWIIEGYSDELLKLYTNDRNAFLNLKYNPWHEEQAQKDPFYNSGSTNNNISY